MNVIIIVFIIVSSLLALSALGYVGVDIFLEKRKKEELQDDAPAPVPVIIPPSVEEPIILPEPVEHIDAEEADAMISDHIALHSALTEQGAGTGLKGTINIGDIDVAFEANAIVTLGALKEKMLIPKNVGRIKILADGILTKPLTVKAESFSVQAIKMIELTGGTVIILKD